MEFCRALAESGADFAEQFDRNSATYHGGITMEVPLGGARVPESMGGESAADWRSLPDAPTAIEDDRDGALSAATESILDMDKADVSDRTRECVEAVVERGKFKFEDKETFGEYMQVLQRANQAIFADQKKLLQRLKDAKKAYAANRDGRAAEAAGREPLHRRFCRGG